MSGTRCSQGPCLGPWSCCNYVDVSGLYSRQRLWRTSGVCTEGESILMSEAHSELALPPPHQSPHGGSIGDLNLGELAPPSSMPLTRESWPCPMPAVWWCRIRRAGFTSHLGSMGGLALMVRCRRATQWHGQKLRSGRALFTPHPGHHRKAVPEGVGVGG